MQTYRGARFGVLIEDHGNGQIISSEYLATSINSGADGVGENDDYTRSSRAENPNLKALTDFRGYVLCDVGRDLWRGDLRVLDTIATRNGTLSTDDSFVTERGKPGLQRA
jgi:alkaline phosphatase D